MSVFFRKWLFREDFTRLEALPRPLGASNGRGGVTYCDVGLDGLMVLLFSVLAATALFLGLEAFLSLCSSFRAVDDVGLEGAESKTDELSLSESDSDEVLVVGLLV